jgi:hypothetical protein
MCSERTAIGGWVWLAVAILRPIASFPFSCIFFLQVELIDLGLGVAVDDDDQDPDVLADPLYSVNLLVRKSAQGLLTAPFCGHWR